jgi:hypothetical protein
MADVTILDRFGQEQDWAWLQSHYGPVTIAGIVGDGYRVVELIEVEGQIVFHCTVGNEAGGPVVGIPVRYEWPDGYQDEITNGSGTAEHTAGGGEKYFPPNQGPISWQVQNVPSEKISGLGWLGGTQYRHLNVIMQWFAGDEEPPPEPVPDGGILERIYDVLIRIANALEADG